MVNSTFTWKMVSSLYGRVYRRMIFSFTDLICFLPVWEGVSFVRITENKKTEFPPCMGGCIEIGCSLSGANYVSSLYGRVYREDYIEFKVDGRFPPCMGGCIGTNRASHNSLEVSSLYERVYRVYPACAKSSKCFLPIREGIGEMLCITQIVKV